MTESEFIRHEPCPDCGSSDALAIYTDGHTFCFSCQTRTAGSGDQHTHQMQENVSFKGSAQRLQNETSAKKLASSIKSTETKHTYASLITMALDALEDSKQKQN